MASLLSAMLAFQLGACAAGTNEATVVSHQEPGSSESGSESLKSDEPQSDGSAADEQTPDERSAGSAADGQTSDEPISDEPSRVEEIVSGMTLDEKISQMIMPAFRQWDGEKMTKLSAAEGLAEALRRHQYGGFILYAQNVADTEQAVRLINELDENNAEIEGVSTHIPYFYSVDQEGGIMSRLSGGTRMTGSMALAATGESAKENARMTGSVIGEELKAIGFNVDLAPVIDVNSNPANTVIGIRAFSDDPSTVAELGLGYMEGLSESGIISTFKHFPGHGDTSVDSHIGTPSVEKTYEELKAMELIPFQKAIEAGADMIMTAHITYPQIDEEVVYGDGETKGYYPATMSRRMITDILRNDMGYEGLVITDAIEMDAIFKAKLVPGEEGSAEYHVNIGKEVINAGVDILLVPQDMVNDEVTAFYDKYIKGLTEKVAEGEIPEERIDESVTRILKVKEKYGILEENKTPLDERIQNALKIVGSDAHHEVERKISREAITLLKNDAATIPVQKAAKKIFILGRAKTDETTIMYAVRKLKEEGLISEDAQITYDYYYDSSAEKNQRLHYTEGMKAGIAGADVVIGVSQMDSLDTLADGDPRYIGISSAIEDTHAAGGKFILLSDKLPYDAARYQEADAIVLSYMGSGLSLVPSEPGSDAAVRTAYNANMIAAIDAIFGAFTPTGTTPVDIPAIGKGDDGSLIFLGEKLYSH